MLGILERTIRPQPIEPRYHNPILPESIRYALQYRDGIFNTTEVRNLIQNKSFHDIGNYLATKLLDRHPLQEDLIVSIANAAYVGEDNTQTIIKTLQEIDPTTTVKGRKTVLVSRRGPEMFSERFKEFAHEADTHNTLPILVGYAGFLGLSAFARYAKPESAFGLFLTDQSIEQGKPVGYTLRLLPNNNYCISNFEAIRSFNQSLCIVDDVVRTHKTATMVTSLLENNDYPEVRYERFATDLSVYSEWRR